MDDDLNSMADAFASSRREAERARNQSAQRESEEWAALERSLSELAHRVAMAASVAGVRGETTTEMVQPQRTGWLGRRPPPVAVERQLGTWKVPFGSGGALRFGTVAFASGLFFCVYEQRTELSEGIDATTRKALREVSLQELSQRGGAHRSRQTRIEVSDLSVRDTLATFMSRHDIRI
ncbi:hypothetical protein [Miltoncostaea oceani]|uniref:hypothetical protein n=1 Tax=Miltoncostaea oceani TaxID=2843216 RepID=UPI001C3CAF89|nr:hypothetical protein [Miltoncostaea oceani]